MAAPRTGVERVLRKKARRLARVRLPQLWLLLSPTEARKLAAGTVPATVRRHCVKWSAG